jgi:hypothetical protein
MRWQVPLVISLALFVAVSCDQQPVGPQAEEVTAPAFNGGHGNPVVHRATLAGADANIWYPPGDAAFSIIALQFADGTSRGQWSDPFYVEPGGPPCGLHVAVDCLNVVGNTAFISGYVTQDKCGEAVGLPAYTQLVDNGPAEDDLMSRSFVGLPFDCTAQIDLGPHGLLHTPRNGQVIVK